MGSTGALRGLCILGSDSAARIVFGKLSKCCHLQVGVSIATLGRHPWPWVMEIACTSTEYMYTYHSKYSTCSLVSLDMDSVRVASNSVTWKTDTISYRNWDQSIPRIEHRFNKELHTLLYAWAYLTQGVDRLSGDLQALFDLISLYGYRQ